MFSHAFRRPPEIIYSIKKNSPFEFKIYVVAEKQQKNIIDWMSK